MESKLILRIPALFVFASMCLLLDGAAAERELIQDPHFQRGFHLLDPKPGKRVVYGELSVRASERPAWDLAQWSSKFPLLTGDWLSAGSRRVCSNASKVVIAGKRGRAEADLSLAVHTGLEYPTARKSPAEPWVHLLAQQELAEPPALGELKACRFHMEARLKHSKLLSTSDYSPAIHAAQFLVYLTVANRNTNAPGFNECFWFGIPVYDNRERIVPAYEAQDFGGTSLFIFTPSSSEYSARSTHSGEWVTFERDLLPLMGKALRSAQSKGFIKASSKLEDFRPLGIFIGWEVPGRFDVDLQIRNLTLKAVLH